MLKGLFVALYEPRMPSNVGAIIRTCACFDIPLIIIEPVGFQWKDPDFKRAKLDYDANITIISSFEEFLDNFENNRKILLTPHTDMLIKKFPFLPGDVLCFGRETDGMELENMQYFQQLLAIEMSSNCRSLNLSVSVAMTLAYINI